MKITFLGTGTSQGVPPIGCTSEVCLSENPKDKRLRASIHLEWRGLSLVVDCGPDFRYQMIRAGISNIDAILFTHEHRDHTAGLDDIRPYNYLQERHVPVYLHPRVYGAFQSQYDYIFQPVPYPGVPLIDWHLIDLEPFDIQGRVICPVEVMHYKLPVLGFIFDKFAYVTDANFISAQEKEKLKGMDVLVLNALRREEHISHFTLSQAVALAKELGAKQTYFTHMSHQIGLHDAVCDELPQGIDLAYDGLVVEIPDTTEL
ncbi:MAG: MBL fold metallo-hydrolase [Sphingomonadales bacterium]|nr:MBL fold metallo-hydrolase [Sphingomonadales bacterium]